MHREIPHFVGMAGVIKGNVNLKVCPYEEPRQLSGNSSAASSQGLLGLRSSPCTRSMIRHRGAGHPSSAPLRDAHNGCERLEEEL